MFCLVASVFACQMNLDSFTLTFGTFNQKVGPCGKRRIEVFYLWVAVAASGWRQENITFVAGHGFKLRVRMKCRSRD